MGEFSLLTIDVKVPDGRLAVARLVAVLEDTWVANSVGKD